ncbi:CAAX prenyl protease N-terminal, five membrane helices, partial [Algoriphagus hitonicola]
MSAESLKHLVIGVVVFGFLVEKILSYLNVKRPVPQVPETLVEYLTLQKLKESKAYQLENYRFGLYSGIFSFVLTILFIWNGWFGVIDSWIGTFVPNPLFQSVVFFAVIFIGSDLLSLPFDYYGTFVIEEKYGFNKTTVGTFFGDKIKGYVLSIFVGGGLLVLFLWLIHQMGA